MKTQSQKTYLHIIIASISVMNYELRANFCIPWGLINITKQGTDSNSNSSRINTKKY
jgi:hypothetical protein